jgi:hypothetical protein
MLPLYTARIEDLGLGGFIKLDCAACHHVALLTPEALLRVGLSPATKVLDLKGRLRCRGGREKRVGGGFGEVAGEGRLDQASGSSLRRRSGTGLGETLDAAPRSAWSGRIVIAKPVDPTRRRSTKCQPRGRGLSRGWKPADQRARTIATR